MRAWKLDTGSNSRKTDDMLIAHIKSVLRIMKRNIPIAVLWYQKGQVRKFGPQNLVKWLESQDKTSMEDAMKSDLESLIDGDEPLVSGTDDYNDSERILAQNLVRGGHTMQLKRLPVPLSLMNKKEKIKYLSDQIHQEVREKEGDPIRFVYGTPNCRPSFWPEDVWGWENCITNLGKIRDHIYTGPGTYNQFLTTCIEKLFKMKNEDPETFVEDLNDKSLWKRKAMRGMLVKDDKDSSVITTSDLFTDELLVNDQAEKITEQEHDDLTNLERCMKSRVQESIMEEINDHLNATVTDEANSDDQHPSKKKPKLTNSGNNSTKSLTMVNGSHSILVDCLKPEVPHDAVDESMKESESNDDDAPVSITINSKGFEPIQITLAKLKKSSNSNGVKNYGKVKS